MSSKCLLFAPGPKASNSAALDTEKLDSVLSMLFLCSLDCVAFVPASDLLCDSTQHCRISKYWASVIPTVLLRMYQKPGGSADHGYITPDILPRCKISLFYGRNATAILVECLQTPINQMCGWTAAQPWR